MPNKTRKIYDEDFKRHIVKLYDAGQTQAELAKAYDLHPTSVSNWVKFYKNSGSFHSKDNLTEEQNKSGSLKNSLKRSKWRLTY